MEGATLSHRPMIAITILRVFVGWHFLYEGVSKLTSPSWSAAGYLKQSRGPFADLFKWLAGQPNLLANADLITMWGLTLVGVFLILGLFTRLASLAGIGVHSAVLPVQPAVRRLLLLDPHRGQLPDRQQEPRGTVRARRHPRDGQRPLRGARPPRAPPRHPAPAACRGVDFIEKFADLHNKERGHSARPAHCQSHDWHRTGVLFSSGGVVQQTSAVMLKLRKSAAGCRDFAERYGDGVVAASAGVLTLCVYLYTIFPGVFMVGDAAKFTFVGKVLGIPHAPGYPLYVAVSHLFSYVPFGTLAYRMNVMSALLGATAVALLYLAGRTLGLERAVALCAALACGLGHAFWAKALYAKTYTLNAALVVGRDALPADGGATPGGRGFSTRRSASSRSASATI